MYSNEITSLLALTRAEHKAIANLATAVLSLVVKLEDAHPSQNSVMALRDDPANPPGARVILDRLERKAARRQ